ncbi:MAG: hypothetical protein GY940_30505 [bacterium]|nr:hypothetical protein [bacterium]
MKTNIILDLIPENDKSFHLYDYCDYLCEKCHVTHKCPIFQEEIEAAESGIPIEEMMQGKMQKTTDLLDALVKEHEIDGYEIDEKLLKNPDINVEAFRKSLRKEDEISDEEMERLEAEDDELENRFLAIEAEVEKKQIYHLGKEYAEKSINYLDTYPPSTMLLSGLEETASDLANYSAVISDKLDRVLFSLGDFVHTSEEYHLMDAYLSSLLLFRTLHGSQEAVSLIRNVFHNDEEELNHLEWLIIQIREELKHECPLEIFLLLLHRLYENQPQDI